MASKKADDLLGPIGENGADYIRKRLRTRVMMELGITMRRPQVLSFLRCLDSAASLIKIRSLHDQVLAETQGPVWSLEIEPRLIEFHGAWRYEGRPEVQQHDMEKAMRFYAVAHVMDALLSQCSFPMVRSREERLDDAAWFSVSQADRG